MTVFSPSGPATGEQGPSPQAGRIPQNLRLSACERLVSGPNRQQAARNLIGSASAHGIDLNLLWGVIQRDQVGPARVRQACLAVLGAGATAMIFHSSPDRDRWLGSNGTQCNEISASLRACLGDLGTMTDRVRLAQCLIEPRNRWASDVFTNAGMIFVGELAYLRQRIEPTPPRHVPEPDWPEGISVRPLHDLQRESIHSDRDALITALEASYVNTLDCPELCGLRNMEDVVDSHMATGVFNAGHWLLIEHEAHPVGCCLLSHCPASGSIELVYLGLGVRARGLGLGRQVLQYATARMTHLGAKEITCAVDTRNTPALRVYESLGFTRFDSRLGFVSSIAET